MSFWPFPSPPSTARPHATLAAQLQKTLRSDYGETRLDLAFSLAPGEWVALLGPSGAGKTTLLRLLAGLAEPDAGRLTVGDRCWYDGARGLHVATRQRRIGFVFQDYALFPNMSAHANLRFAQPRASRRSVDELLAAVGLAGLGERLPHQLSGGQQQRLALARALATEPDFLFLDEPLSALDPRLRRELQDLLLTVRRSQPLSALIVTHDPGEALRLCDRALLMEHGHIVADAPPAQLFGGDGEELLLAGEVLESVRGDDGTLSYRIDAGGLCCRAEAAAGTTLQAGERVLLQAHQLSVRPLREV
jgi:molybdate transport system ATP-binding protein